MSEPAETDLGSDADASRTRGVHARRTDADTVSYEAARDELIEVVRVLEAGALPLEKSLALWERGEELAAICQSWLDGARERLAARRPADHPADGNSATAG